MKPGKVYTLTNPVGNIIFYVGSTSISLSGRLRAHVYNGRNMQIGSVGRYLAKLSVKPIIEAIECFDFVSKQDLMMSELFWIRQLKNWGFPLVNDGMPNDGVKQKNCRLTTDEVLFLTSKKSYAQVIRVYYNIDIPDNTLSSVIKRGRCTYSVYQKILVLISKLKELDYSRLVLGQRIVKILLSDSQLEKINNMMSSSRKNTLLEIGICKESLREILRTRLMRYDKYLNKQSILGQ